MKEKCIWCNSTENLGEVGTYFKGINGVNSEGIFGKICIDCHAGMQGAINNFIDKKQGNVEYSPSKFQRIIRWLPHKIDIFLFELLGGLKKTEGTKKWNKKN